MREGDIYQLSTGRIFKVLEANFPEKGSARIQDLEEDESRIVSNANFKQAQFMGGPGSIPYLLFDMTRSVHLRLNNLNRV